MVEVACLGNISISRTCQLPLENPEPMGWTCPRRKFARISCGFRTVFRTTMSRCVRLKTGAENRRFQGQRILEDSEIFVRDDPVNLPSSAVSFFSYSAP